MLLFFVVFVLIDVVVGVLVVLCRFTSDCFLDVVVLFLAIVVAIVLRCLCFNWLVFLSFFVVSRQIVSWMLLYCFSLLLLLLFFVVFVLTDVVVVGVLVFLCRFTSDCFLDVVVLFLTIVVAIVLRCLCFS